LDARVLAKTKRERDFALLYSCGILATGPVVSGVELERPQPVGVRDLVLAACCARKLEIAAGLFHAVRRDNGLVPTSFCLSRVSAIMTCGSRP